MKILVLHRYYGCDTGCCGHVVEVDGKEGKFQFDHPYGDDFKTFIKEFVTEQLGKKHVKDIDWENCEVSDD